MKTVYLDNAATTFIKPSCVIRDLNFCLKRSCGNPGRSSHQLSLRASEIVYETSANFANDLCVNRFSSYSARRNDIWELL